MKHIESSWIDGGRLRGVALVAQPSDVVHLKEVTGAQNTEVSVTRGATWITLGVHTHDEAMDLWREIVAAIEAANAR